MARFQIRCSLPVSHFSKGATSFNSMNPYRALRLFWGPNHAPLTILPLHNEDLVAYLQTALWIKRELTIECCTAQLLCRLQHRLIFATTAVAQAAGAEQASGKGLDSGIAPVSSR